jgi:hypothetical protein
VEAVKRGRGAGVEDVAICAATGWTWQELEAQPARFVARLAAYLSAVADAQSREAEEGLRRMKA